MAIHNSMVELCCYAAPIDVEIASKSPICTEFFNTYPCYHQLILNRASVERSPASFPRAPGFAQHRDQPAD